ncbi:hypothetical protein N7478_002901 [Penicillium angulare]|uniref:uncharacterized protein n=1 Tax=Penicillium angulare TaxID=116970 RepID=UPI00254252BB|nr:uncharacterized protein N7478_002901 [Penicillium angulare]KAJ5287215.1 hypothetical protein N7478_002901 [Penicillium angulare]
MSDFTPRKRSRAACLSCQSRKRKCSGEQPCATCIQAGVDCHYSTAPRKKRPRSNSAYRAPLPSLDESQRRADGLSHFAPKPVSAAGSTTSPASFNWTDESRGMSHSLEANSGAAFVRKLGLRIDPARAPRLHLFAWNVGERRLSPALAAREISVSAPGFITKLLSQEDMCHLTAIYFEKVDPCYPFLDRLNVLSRIAQRWQSPLDLSEQPYDAVLYGIAAFGYLFSRREIIVTELQLVEGAHKILQKSVIGAESPSIDAIAAWVLRAAYMRMTASPHAAWMASCTLMHLIEAAGLHLESPDPESNLNSDSQQISSTTINPQSKSTETKNILDTRRRLFGMARHLNTWISFDLGRSRVLLHGASQPIPLSQDKTTRASLFHLLPLSESLDPTTSSQSLPTLESALKSVLDLSYSTSSLILVQTNLTLCIYRRVRAINAHALLPQDLDRVLALAQRGLRAARHMVLASSPWHQVANVPFQVVCTLLAIDSRPALALLPDAMATLGEVLAAYDTASMREAYSTAYLLVAMHQRRKEDDTRALGDVLRANAAAAVAQPLPREEVNRRVDAVVARAGEGERVDEQVQIPVPRTMEFGPVSDAEVSWLGDLVIDIPSLQNFDIDQFLMTDVPWPWPEMGI